MTSRRRRIRRFAGVLLAIGLVLAVPSLVDARPAPADRTVTAAAVLAQVAASTRTGYSGYAQSVGSATIPDVQELGILPSLLGDVTMLRVWWSSADRWRVDKLSNTDEDDTYAFPGGSWEWDSPTRTATVVTAVAPVRLLRPADLTPDQLGRRLAVLAGRPGVTAVRDGARRLAGRTALGVRLTGGTGTTVAAIQLWVDAATGVPLGASVTPVGATRPVLTTSFLTFDDHPPAAFTDTFQPSPGTRVQQVDDSALRGVLGRLAPLPVTDTVAGLPLTGGIPGEQGVAVFAQGLAQVAAVGLSRGDADRLDAALGSAATRTDTDGGRISTVSTPLVNLALLDVRGLHVLVLGTVPPKTLMAALSDLRASRRMFFFGPDGQPT